LDILSISESSTIAKNCNICPLVTKISLSDILNIGLEFETISISRTSDIFRIVTRRLHFYGEFRNFATLAGINI